MSRKTATRHCVSPEALSILRRDGIGWGHDLDCGCFHVAREGRKPGPFARMIQSISRRT